MKKTAFFLSFMLMISLFAGCGKNGASTDTSSASDSGILSQEDTSKETISEKSAETVDPAVSSESEDQKTEETENETMEPENETAPEENISVIPVSSAFFVRGTSSLNIRASYSTDSEIIGSLQNEASGEVTGVTSDGKWYRIDVGDAAGYISADYIAVGEEAEALADSVAARMEEEKAGNGFAVCIDAGHQQTQITETEPNGPGSSVMKAKLTSGTAGCSTGIAEYVVNLQVALKLQEELQNRGYTVYMIRTTNDCPMSNAERAVYANETGSDCFIRIHCNGSEDSSVTGVVNYAPSPANPYLSADVISKSNTLAQTLANTMCAATGALNRGVIQSDTMTGINWCTIPVAILEMGFMSNPTEDALLCSDDYQWKMVKGIADGIDTWLGQ